MHSTRCRAARWLLIAVLVVAPVTACGDDPPDQMPDAEAPATEATQAAAPSSEPSDPSREPAPEPPSEDQLAGLLSREVSDSGTGELQVVPGVASAPGPGEVWQVKVSVEGGLDVDGAAFASLVMSTLNDPRGWTQDGLSFARTDGDDHDVEVVLASPDTSERLCRPLVTRGTLSCRSGDQAVITLYRWVHGTEDYGDDLTAYRQYVVNHEVGHALGHGHVGCPGAGQPAPLMMQQTLGLDGCAPNPWPHP